MRKLRKIRLHQEGTHQLIVGFFVWLIVNAITYWFTYPELRWLFILIATFTTTIYLLLVNFFRCPPRRFPGEDTEGIVVAPADGKVVVIEEVEEPDYFHDRRLMISIFMSPLNVHANWYPVDGVVKVVTHDNGKFHRAFLPKASTDNERSMVVMETPDGKEVMVLGMWRRIGYFNLASMVWFPVVFWFMVTHTSVPTGRYTSTREPSLMNPKCWSMKHSSPGLA